MTANERIHTVKRTNQPLFSAARACLHVCACMRAPSRISADAGLHPPAPPCCRCCCYEAMPHQRSHCCCCCFCPCWAAGWAPLRGWRQPRHAREPAPCAGRPAPVGGSRQEGFKRFAFINTLGQVLERRVMLPGSGDCQVLDSAAPALPHDQVMVMMVKHLFPPCLAVQVTCASHHSWQRVGERGVGRCRQSTGNAPRNAVAPTPAKQDISPALRARHTLLSRIWSSPPRCSPGCQDAASGAAAALCLRRKVHDVEQRHHPRVAAPGWLEAPLAFEVVGMAAGPGRAAWEL